MILCISLNPAVDRTCRLDGELACGAVNRIKSLTDYPGGKAVNVARYLRLYDECVCVSGFAGGYGGELIAGSLEQAGARTAMVRTKAATRINYNILGADGAVTELLEPGEAVTDRELLEFRTLFTKLLAEAELIILSGSLPAGVPGDIYAQLIAEAHGAGVKAILDASGEALREGVKAAPELIKPNLSELSSLMHEDIETVEQAASAAERLIHDHGIGAVVVSMGDRGMLWLDKAERLFLPAPKVVFANSVSCGDAAVASLAISYLAKAAPAESLKRAVALSAAAAECVESGQADVTRADVLYGELGGSG